MRFLIIFSLFFATSLAQDNSWLCESLICDPPKKCVLIDQVAQCQVDESATPAPFGTINGGQSLFPSPGDNTPPPFTFPSPAPPAPQNTPPPFTFPTPATTPPTLIPNPTTTPPSPFAPFLNFLNGGMASGGPAPTLLPPFTLPTLPTTPQPPTTPRIDICLLPPVTGSCSRARIMWYYDNESRRCERFSWSGCGNENRFTSKLQCEQTCSQTSLFRGN
ncbi:unnamed protein product [Caenorhabditis bovis]|uniref:BPTI/Kunitz inhibitor domain-containing protein n=1 Tax=Caenorhabditis bovis TaxID=2654633 RepID=A0A8S1FA52_9PELO|nr:unnamed protein product [Caenorhabditis bovis]